MAEPASPASTWLSRQWHRLLTSPHRLDAIVAASVALVAYGVAHHALTANFHVAVALEDLFAPCTGRPGWMFDYSTLYALPQWTAFLDRRIEYFPCEAVARLKLFEVGITWDLQWYLHLALSTWFRIVGPTINGFVTFQSVSYAITSAFAYLIFRLGVGRIVAVACAAAIIWSPSHLKMASLIVEYSKAPWALAAVWLCGVTVLRDSAGKPLGWIPAALGLVAGLGIGFKPDLIAMVPLVVATPLLFVSGQRSHVAAPKTTAKTTAALLVVAGIAVGGGAVLARNFSSPTGSLLPVQVLGGQDWQTESLSASSPLYDYAITWDDSYVTWMINSYGHRVLGTTAISVFFSREMQEQATRLLTDMWTTFPGDLVLRVIAATVRVLRLSGMHLAVAIAGLFVVFCANRRHGWFVVFITTYLCAYVSLVFQLRHIFHLEFISWWLAGVLVHAFAIQILAVWKRRRDRGTAGGWIGALAGTGARLVRPAFGAALCLLLIAAATWTVLTAARQYQQMRMLRLVDHYQQMPVEARRIVSTSVAGTSNVRVNVEGVSVPKGLGDTDAAWSDYLVLRFRCRAHGIIRVKSMFVPTPVLPEWSNWNRDFSVPCANAGGESTLMMPVYQYGDAYRFDNLILSGDDAATLVSTSTMLADSSVRLWLNLLIPDNWRAHRWFETMKLPPAMPI